MKKVVLVIIIVIVALGAGLGAGVFITNAKSKAAIADMQKKMQQSEAASQERINNCNATVDKLNGDLQLAKFENETLKNPTPASEQATATAPAATASAGNTKTDNSIPTDAKQYTIKSGDSLWSIAKSQLGNGSRVNDILKLNPKLTAKSNLVVGSKLTIPSK
ncbi:MAG: LysM domain-containing protein [Sedimentisphaerales bacterium]|jgi:nucleoid-associated protein YgaU